jgi:hypothetical protein
VEPVRPEEAQAVASRDDLVAYLIDLSSRAREGRTAVENASTPEFIEAAAYWTRAMDGFFANRGEEAPEAPSWSTIAMIFSAALVYE